MASDCDTGYGLYVHVPFCTKKCAYCAFYSEPVDKHDAVRVVSAIIREIDGYGHIDVKTAYIGGGSPSCLSVGELYRLAEKVYGFNQEMEITVEVNPSQVNNEILKGLVARGVNRLSIGGQSFDVNELKLLGRGHNSADIIKAVEVGEKLRF